MISIIVPVYRVEPYLKRCIDSIINQTIKNIEILLIDDGSPDKCGVICDLYAKVDKRIKVYHTENRGLSAARNLGLREAKGEYIGFVDSDDWIEADMYEILLKELKTNNADVCECSFWYESERSRQTLNKEYLFRDKESLIGLFDGRINDVVWNKLYRRDVLETLSFPEGHNCEDIFMMHLILTRTKKVVVLADPKYHYRQRIDSIRFTYSADNLIDYANAFLNRYEYYRLNNVLNHYDIADQLFPVSAAISKLWRWWYGCDSSDKIKYKNEIHMFKLFIKNHLPLLGYSSWPGYLRLSSVFMHTDCIISFMILYIINQLYRRVLPNKGNVITYETIGFTRLNHV